ncbi:unnamed protein product [Rangifer tarandus platyrhynchus]|uniref:Uncharacterized protein n=3 Tax=Rangifer tarandus platyrhynchus TaxID=3082113 RepID=A0AC59ZRI7_RANTA|nr:unnamed protein product [Rangifer tarandus platyrhynchus]
MGLPRPCCGWRGRLEHGMGRPASLAALFRLSRGQGRLSWSLSLLNETKAEPKARGGGGPAEAPSRRSYLLPGGLWVTTLQDESLCDSVCPRLAPASQRVTGAHVPRRLLRGRSAPACPVAMSRRGPEGPGPDRTVEHGEGVGQACCRVCSVDPRLGLQAQAEPARMPSPAWPSQAVFPEVGDSRTLSPGPAPGATDPQADQTCVSSGAERNRNCGLPVGKTYLELNEWPVPPL